MMDICEAWRGFEGRSWKEKIDLREFILKNYTPYDGDSSFLAGPSERTLDLWSTVRELMKEEAKKGVLDLDTSIVSSITSHGPGYIDREKEQIVGLQTDHPLKRALMPFGGIRTAESAAEAYGYKVDERLSEVFTKYRKTHNQGVFEVYTPEMRAARKSGIITGLPDAYGRGRIIGDYRRAALYGLRRLIADKEREKSELDGSAMTEEVIRLREELSEQILALHELGQMAESYGFNMMEPATDARQAIQWTYFAYLAATKEQNGAAMSLGRVSTFLDIYVVRDLQEGTLSESEAQELIDQFIMKLRIIRFARTPDYDKLFSGDPTWVTEVIGGMALDGRSLVSKSSFRFLQTLLNLGPAPEPNLTVLWSTRLPEAFKSFCARISNKTSAIQYENDDLMRANYGDDYGIACCVSAMKIGKQMQFFGARANLAKALLYAINGGKDEVTGEQIGPRLEAIKGDVLEIGEVTENFSIMTDWLAKLYVQILNVIHYMHDKYSYEKLEMALHDRDVVRTLACGIAGLSVVADSLSAIRYGRVVVKRNAEGLATDFECTGDFPKFGNNDERVDQIARDLVSSFMGKLRHQQTYRRAIPTQSILTITSNVVYGKKTGSTPDGRKMGEAFAPGANPMHGRDERGALASMKSVAKLPYEDAQDGISYTFSVVPSALGKLDKERDANMVGLLDSYFIEGGHHINVNSLNRETLLEAMENPDEYPQLTIRVSGYAVNFHRLTREQQLEVISRTFHERA